MIPAQWSSVPDWMRMVSNAVNPLLSGVASAVVTPQQFYQATDPDYFDAFDRARISLLTSATTGYGYGDTGTAKLFVPQMSTAYPMGGRTLDLTHGIIIEGESVGYAGPGSSVLKWDANTTGIRFQNGSSTGATGVLGTPTDVYSNSSVLRNLTLYGPNSGAEGEYHGVHMRANGVLDNVGIFNFQGDSVHIAASSGSGVPLEGNTNSFHLQRVFAQACRHGFFIDGADANAGTIIACNAISNRAWGFWDSSFLGNTYFGCHSAGNGWDGAASSIPTACTYLGKRYFVMPGQAVGAATNAPSGTTADNTWWGYISAGGTGNGVVAWVNPTTFREGGSYKTDDANAQSVFVGCYSENDQNPPQIVARSIVLGGVVAIQNRGIGMSFRSDSGSVPILTRGALLDNPTEGSACVLTFQSNTAGIPTADGTISNVGLAGLRYNATNYHEVFVASSRVHYTSSAGINLDTGKVITIDGNQVLGARQTGTAAVATDLATAITLVNDLRAKLVTHGAIL